MNTILISLIQKMDEKSREQTWVSEVWLTWLGELVIVIGNPLYVAARLYLIVESFASF